MPTLSLKVLHLDDDPFELERVKNALETNALDCTFTVESVNNVIDYRQKLSHYPDIVILDIHVNDPQFTGITLTRDTRESAPDTVILMCSTADDLRTIADCLNADADDFISKMSDKGELSLRVFNSYRLATMKRGGNFTAKAVNKDKPLPVGTTMERIARRIPLILDSAISAIFITGESGTGKEVVADLIGSALPPDTPFIKVNCGAIAPSLLESELFGHVKGAFTGATADKRGLLEAASGGWIFLDEVATLSPSAQVALLRVLEDHTVLRVGSTKPVALDLRVLSATNEPLETLVQDGKFRADLLQRLRETEINLPPLRQRPDEIPALVERFCNKMHGGPYAVSGPAMAILTSSSWRAGNIRELRNCLRAMTEMHVNKLLTPLSIPERIWEEIGENPEAQTQDQTEIKPQVTLNNADDHDIVIPWKFNDKQTYEQLTDLLLLTMTRKVAARNGRLSLRSLAQTIGMSRSTLSSRLKNLVHRNLISTNELSQLVGINEA